MRKHTVLSAGNLRKVTSMVFLALGLMFSMWFGLSSGLVLAAPEETSGSGLKIEPVSPEKMASGMDSLANDIDTLAGGLAVPMGLILLFLSIITFLIAILFKKAKGIAVGFLIMALVFFLVFGDLKATVNLLLGTLEWIKGHF